MKHQTPAQSYNQNGNIMCGLLLLFKKILNRKIHSNKKFFRFFFLVLEKCNKHVKQV